MLNTNGLTLSPTRHALVQIQTKEIDPNLVVDAFKFPGCTYATTEDPTKIRIVANGICLIGRVEGDRYVLITVHLQSPPTAVREDQLQTAKGRAYAKRLAAGTAG